MTERISRPLKVNSQAKCWGKQIKYWAAAIVLCGLSTNLLADDLPRKVVEYFDGYCYRAEARYEDIVSSSEALQLKALPDSMLPLLMGMDSSEGAAYVLDMDRDSGVGILLGASKPNACSVTAQGISLRPVRELLIESFRLHKVATDDIGMQISELYVPGGTTGTRQEVAQLGVVILTYSKDQSTSLLSIGYLPPITAKRVLSP